MPHYTVTITEETLDGHVEANLIRTLTDAAVDVYGEDFRPLVGVDIFGIPRDRWGTGGAQVTRDEVQVTLRVREGAFQAFPDAATRLIRSITQATGEVLGDDVRSRTTVNLVGVPAGRTGAAGEVA